GINATSGATHTRVDLQKEAIRLARLLAELLPAETEVRGLLALLLLTHARDRARVSADGSPVPLSEQDRSRWGSHLVAERIGLVCTATADTASALIHN